MMRRCDSCGEVRCRCLADLRIEVAELRRRPPDVIVPDVLGPDDTLVVVVPVSTSMEVAVRMVDVAKSKGVQLLVASAVSAAVVRG